MLLMKIFSVLDNKNIENKNLLVWCYTGLFGILLVLSLCGVSKTCAIAVLAMVADLFVAISTQ